MKSKLNLITYASVLAKQEAEAIIETNTTLDKVMIFHQLNQELKY